jgi:hypothetical protein
MRATVFVGPSLYRHPLLADRRFDWRPPAATGDLYRAAQQLPDLIGLIDGQFESTPTVWHKEILWALSQGIRVYGAASIGALRAVELAPFGMVGVGAIYRDFRDGRLQDDDEVAVMYADDESGFRPLTEPMVDIRASVDAARDAGILSARSAAVLVACAKKLFFKDRTWPRVLKETLAAGVPTVQLTRLKRWNLQNRVEQKRLDASALVRAIRRQITKPSPSRPVPPNFAFQHTIHWQRVMDLYER